MPDLRPLHQLIDSLPADGKWNAALRERWLTAVARAVDYTIDVPEEVNP